MSGLTFKDIITSWTNELIINILVVVLLMSHIYAAEFHEQKPKKCVHRAHRHTHMHTQSTSKCTVAAGSAYIKILFILLTIFGLFGLIKLSGSRMLDIQQV